MTHYSVEPKTRIYAKEYEFLSFERNLSDKHGKKILNTATKTGLDTAKTVLKK